MGLMAQVDQARSRLQATNEQLSEARGLLGKPKQEAPKEPEEKGLFDRLKETVSNVSLSDVGHTVLDVAGLVPVIGAPADAISAVWYLAEGDKTNAALSAVGMIPFVGEAAVAGKLGAKGVDALRGADEAADAARAADAPTAPKLDDPVPGLEGAKYGSIKNNGSPEDRAYAERVTGNNTGLSPHVWNGERDVELDGVEFGRNGEITLLEAKNAGENSIYSKDFMDTKNLQQARDQVAAARESGATGVKWLVRNPETAEHLQDLFNDNGLNITVTHVP